MEPGAYCRRVEAYLCRRNAGHLIRIVGPAFDLVRGWETRQIPLSVVFRAIDRTVERRAATGARRRPVRIEFCEADVDELFDDWRRAVGVGGGDHAAAGSAGRPRRTLVTHVERAILELTVVRGSERHAPALGELAGQVVGELDGLRGAAKTARGDARRRLLARLADLDQALMTVARDTADASLRETIRRETEGDLAPYRARMPADTFRKSLQAGTDRLLRERLELPRIAFE